MIRKLQLLLLSTILGFLTISCDEDAVTPGDKVEIYLLSSFETIDNSCQIDEASIMIKSQPLLQYSDLLSYNSNDYIFSLSNNAKETIAALDFPTNGVPFVVTVDREIIYTAYFWPAYSSASCQWIVADPFSIDFNDGLKIQLGYPGHMDGIEIPDKRNDPRILAVFRKDGNLVE